MSDRFASELSSRLTAAMAAASPLHPAPGVDDEVFDASFQIVAPTRHEVIEALSLGNIVSCSLEVSVFNLQKQNNIILRYILKSFASSSTSPQSSGSDYRLSPLLLSPAAGASQSGRGPSPPACFTCPLCSETLCEKSFTKHIKEWPKKAAKIVEGRRLRKEKCPGICSVDHPLLRLTTGVGDLVARVETLVSIVCRMMTPGAYKAHRPEGTGNESRVQAYFDMLWPRSE